MNILLDTHVAIWALLDSPKLTQKARDLILDQGNTIYYSVVSVWEVLLKHSVHPENMELTAESFARFCANAGFVLLELYEKHVVAAESLPAEVQGHKDPFDRLLLSQALSEGLKMLTSDKKLLLYPGNSVIVQ